MKKLKKRVHLRIPEPCHENWEDMTPNERGRFCQNCQKDVIDFTQATPSEIGHFFKNQPKMSIKEDK